MNKRELFVVCCTVLTLAGCSTLSSLSALRSQQTSLSDSTLSDTTVTGITSDRDSQGGQANSSYLGWWGDET